MSGTKIGGRRAAKTNKVRYGDNFYREIGAKGGRNSNSGGFASNVIGADGLTGRERAALIAKKSGRMGKRGYKLIKKTFFHYFYQNKVTGEIVKFPAIK